MNSLSTWTVTCAAAGLASISVVSISSGSLAAASVAAVAFVAFAAQFGRLRDEQRLVYRPVHVRRQIVRRRVRSDLD